MKTKITITACLMGLMFANAQITLDENNVLHSTNYTEDRDYIFSGIAVPQEGVDQVYDYSSLSLPTSTITKTFEPVTRPEYSNSTRFFIGATSLGPISLSAEYYELQDATGLYETGSYTLPSTQNLQALTGNSNDFIEFPGNSQVFEQPATNLSFPASFGMSEVSNYDFVTNYELTVAAFGLSATPGQNIQSVVNTTEVVGYGELILPVPGGQSIPYDVLLVKEERVITNNVFLGGAPAPDALLSAFGLTQGQTDTVAFYTFYAENYEVPIMRIIMNEDFTETDQMYYDMDLLQTLGVANNEFSNSLKIFPNPASDRVSITQDSNLETFNMIEIYDLLGKQVKSIDSRTFIDQQMDIDVSDLTNGTLYVCFLF